jgi:hypothetical protein
MAKLTDPDQLSVGTELSLDTSARTFTLNVTGNLVAKDGVTMQAVYSKFVELWTTSTYNKFPFPMYAIDALSGQFQFGTDGQTYNGWKPANDATRTYLRDGGWSEYSSGGVLNRQYVGIVSLGTVSTSAQIYYQRTLAPGTSAYTNFTFQDAPNQGIQVYGDASNGNYDTRTYFKGYLREYGYKYDDSVLGDTGKTGTGAYIVNLLLQNESDLKIQDVDATVATSSAYTGITVTYYASAQMRTIGASSYPFRVIIDGNYRSAEEVYTKVQYLLRQSFNINSGSAITGPVIGRTASVLLNFVGDTLYTVRSDTGSGTYIDNYDPDDINRLIFVDSNGNNQQEPYTSTGTLNFNSFLQTGGSGYYRIYFTTLGVSAYGQTDAVTVNNKLGNAIFGTITGASTSFTFDYDGNSQGGRTPGTDAAVTVVAGNVGYAKPVVTTHTITRTTGQSITLTAEQDRAYNT